MKILIFGIDGLGKTSLETLGLKRLAARMGKGKVDNPVIRNVISRGWPEIYTGRDAYQTGGFYQVPEYKNSKILPTQNTGLSTIKKIIGKEDLLWNVLNKMDYTVGLFTVPTISKPEDINGFCVAATGAGKFGNDVTEDDLFPRTLLKGLHIKEIDLGFRMGYGAFMPMDINDLEINANKHIADYFYTLNRVLDKNPVDVLFAATRFINEMGYKYLGVCLNEPTNDFEKKLKHTVLSLTNSFDQQLDDFINKVSPDHLFIVSDHGINKYEFDLNINQLLFDNNLIKKDQTLSRLIKQMIKKLLYEVKPKKFGPITPKYDFQSQSFFSIGYMNALYLKDQRFGGNNYSTEEAYELSKELADKLNQYVKKIDLEKYIKFKALNTLPYVGNKNIKIPLPNILCDMASGLNNSERKFSVLERKDFEFQKMFTHGFNGEHSGCKTEDTLASYNGTMEESVDLSDLKSVYSSIIEIAKNIKASK